jgi:hypothetical protein
MHRAKRPNAPGNNYHDAIETLVKNYNDYAAALSSLSATNKQLLQFAKQYHGFINEHLLWIPSSGLIPMTQPSQLFAGLQGATPRARISSLGGACQGCRRHGCRRQAYMEVFTVSPDRHCPDLSQ